MLCGILTLKRKEERAKTTAIVFVTNCYACPLPNTMANPENIRRGGGAVASCTLLGSGGLMMEERRNRT